MRIVIMRKRDEKLIRNAVNSQYERCVEAANEAAGEDAEEMLAEANDYLAVTRRFWPKGRHAQGGRVGEHGFFVLNGD